MKYFKEFTDVAAAIAAPNTRPALKLARDLLHIFPEAAGATTKHQAWRGGYYDHIVDMANIAYDLWQLWGKGITEFTFNDVLLVLYLHDCEKPFRRANEKQLLHFPWAEKTPGKSDEAFRDHLMKEYRFIINHRIRNAISHTEGEHSDYSPTTRTMSELATFSHICDVASARIWHSERYS